MLWLPLTRKNLNNCFFFFFFLIKITLFNLTHILTKSYGIIIFVVNGVVKCLFLNNKKKTQDILLVYKKFESVVAVVF